MTVHVKSFTPFLHTKFCICLTCSILAVLYDTTEVLHICYMSKFYIFLTFQSFTFSCHIAGVQYVVYISILYLNFLHVQNVPLFYMSKLYIYFSYSITVFLSRQLFTCLTVLQYLYHVNCLLFLQFYSIFITSTVFHCLRQFIHLIQ